MAFSTQVSRPNGITVNGIDLQRPFFSPAREINSSLTTLRNGIDPYGSGARNNRRQNKNVDHKQEYNIGSRSRKTENFGMYSDSNSRSRACVSKTPTDEFSLQTRIDKGWSAMDDSKEIPRRSPEVKISTRDSIDDSALSDGSNMNSGGMNKSSPLLRNSNSYANKKSPDSAGDTISVNVQTSYDRNFPIRPVTAVQGTARAKR